MEVRSLKSCWQSCIPSGDAGGEFIHFPFLTSRGCLQSWLMLSSSIFKARNSQSSFSLIKSLSFLPPSFTYKDPCDFIGSTQIIQDNNLISECLNLITSAKFLLPCKVTYSRSCGLGSGHLLGASVLPLKYPLPHQTSVVTAIVPTLESQKWTDGA